MKALVTGGAGFIGSKLSKRLLNDGYDVYVIDNLSTGKLENIPTNISDFFNIDVGSEDASEILKKLELRKIFHLAAQSSGEISFRDPIYDIKTNTISTIRLCEFALQNKVESFVYTSSMSVYGDSGILTKENIACKPNSFYGIGKLASEKYLKLYYALGLKSVALRLFNVFGPGQNMENMNQGMLSIYLAQALKKSEILVKGSLKRFRDFVYIDDVVDAIINADAFNSISQNFQSINISTGGKTTVEFLINLISKKLKKNLSITTLEDTPGDTFGITGDNKKSKILLNQNYNFSLEKGLDKTIKWETK